MTHLLSHHFQNPNRQPESCNPNSYSFLYFLPNIPWYPTQILYIKPTQLWPAWPIWPMMSSHLLPLANIMSCWHRPCTTAPHRPPSRERPSTTPRLLLSNPIMAPHLTRSWTPPTKNQNLEWCLLTASLLESFSSPPLRANKRHHNPVASCRTHSHPSPVSSSLLKSTSSTSFIDRRCLSASPSRICHELPPVRITASVSSS